MDAELERTRVAGPERVEVILAARPVQRGGRCDVGQGAWRKRELRVAVVVPARLDRVADVEGRPRVTVAGRRYDHGLAHGRACLHGAVDGGPGGRMHGATHR